MEKRTIVSWSIFLVLIFFIGFFSYSYFSNKVDSYRVNICLEDFSKSYSNYGLIYEYDSYCKKIFSDYDNLFYCENLSNKDFCLYSFATFIKDKVIKKKICSEISEVKLRFSCDNFFIEID